MYTIGVLVSSRPAQSEPPASQDTKGGSKEPRWILDFVAEGAALDLLGDRKEDCDHDAPRFIYTRAKV